MSGFVKLSTTYYNDLAIASLDDASEVMFTRGLSYCGSAGSKGFIPAGSLQSLSRKPTLHQCRAVAARLVKANLWVAEQGGWRIRSWDHWQAGLDAVEERRRKDRERKAAERSRVRGQSRDESADVTGTEIREKRGDAAAAADTSPDTLDARRLRVDELPPPLLDLKAKLEAVNLVVRWDRLTTDQADQIAGLLSTHSAARLVKSAQGQWQKDNPPAWVQAWIGGWEAIPRAVARPTAERCDVHGQEQPCTGCAADRKAAS